jgi:hypothetical protein
VKLLEIEPGVICPSYCRDGISAAFMFSFPHGNFLVILQDTTEEKLHQSNELLIHLLTDEMTE